MERKEQFVSYKQLELENGDIFAGIFSLSPTSSIGLKYGAVEFLRKVDLPQRYPNVDPSQLLGQAIEAFRVLGQIVGVAGGVISVILWVKRRYKKKEQVGKEKKKLFWPLFCAEKLTGRQFLNLVNASTYAGPLAEQKTINEMAVAMNRKGGNIKLVKFSSRAHFRDID
jgi:hypothetical protein